MACLTVPSKRQTGGGAGEEGGSAQDENIVKMNKNNHLAIYMHALVGIDCTPVSNISELEPMTRRNAEAVVYEACQLPRVDSENGVYVNLPPPTKNCTFVLPRMHPWPSRRVKETKWKAFARAKGITKRHRSRLVWSDVANDWVPRWGARSSHAREQAAHTSAGVVELPGESEYVGRLGRTGGGGVKKLGKRVKKELQKAGSRLRGSSSKSAGGKQQRASVEASELDPFAARKLRTAKQKLRAARSQLEAQAKGRQLPPGVLAEVGGNKGGKSRKGGKITKLSSQKKSHRGQTKEELKEVMGRAQVSTASFGTFDRLAKNEKKEKPKASSRGKSISLKEERGSYLKQLKQVLHQKSTR